MAFRHDDSDTRFRMNFIEEQKKIANGVLATIFKGSEIQTLQLCRENEDLRRQLDFIRHEHKLCSERGRGKFDTGSSKDKCSTGSLTGVEVIQEKLRIATEIADQAQTQLRKDRGKLCDWNRLAKRCPVARSLRSLQLDDPQGKTMSPGDDRALVDETAIEGQLETRNTTIHSSTPASGKLGPQEDQPDAGSSFVNQLGPRGSEGSSPRLPPMPKQLDHRENSVPQFSLSDLTAPPTDSPTASVPGNPMQGPRSDSPEFLSARCVRKRASKHTVESEPVAKETTGPVLIKSDPDTPQATKPRLSHEVPSFVHESLDPRSSGETTSPRRPRPLGTTALSQKSVQQSLVSPFLPISRSIAGTLGDGLDSDRPERRSSMTFEGRETRSDKRSTPLRSIDGNVRRLPPSVKRYEPLSKKRKSDEHRSMPMISTLAEDGSDIVKRPRRSNQDRSSEDRNAFEESLGRLGHLLGDSPGHNPPSVVSIPKKDIEEMEGRLSHRLLNCDYPSRKALGDLLNVEDKGWAWWNNANGLLGGQQHLPFWHPTTLDKRRAERAQKARTEHTATSIESKASNPQPKSSLARPMLTTKSTPGGSSKSPQSAVQTPYRSLPLSSLTPSHFKINPAANQFLDYAFVDVVRNASDRAHLPGCTRPECCGPKFAALAKNLPAKVQLPPNEHHLPQQQGQTAQPPPSAMAQNLANKYGKGHRALHPRPQSPPGFWNVDFPLTQEREEQKKEAERRESELVKQRWKVAMGQEADNGKKERLWMFADE